MKPQTQNGNPTGTPLTLPTFTPEMLEKVFPGMNVDANAFNQLMRPVIAFAAQYADLATREVAESVQPLQEFVTESREKAFYGDFFAENEDLKPYSDYVKALEVPSKEGDTLQSYAARLRDLAREKIPSFNPAYVAPTKAPTDVTTPPVQGAPAANVTPPAVKPAAPPITAPTPQALAGAARAAPVPPQKTSARPEDNRIMSLSQMFPGLKVTPLGAPAAPTPA